MAAAQARLPPRAGVGLRAAHYADMLDTLPDVGWLEVHGENYFHAGGPVLHILDRLRERYPLAAHCVGMSLGSADGLDMAHLSKLKYVVERYQPALVSDHLSWCAIDGMHVNDLLPLPYTEEALDIVCANILRAQEFLGRQILIENVSSYVRFRHATIAEWEFLAEVARRSGCGILLDVNNVYVNAVNHGFDAAHYLTSIPVAMVQEIHLAGFSEGDACLIDTHSRAVAPEVWQLYAKALQRFGAVPTLIEWDADQPPLSVLLAEAATASVMMEMLSVDAVA